MDDPEQLRPTPRPIEDVLPSAELLAHCKSRIDQFEAERDDLLAAVDRCAVHRDDVHRLEWENRKRADEVKELQKALSDAQQFLFEERQRLLLLQAENDELKLQEIQDRQRIQQLLAMTQPLEQTVTFKQGGAPSSVTAFPKQPQGAAAASAGAAAARAGSPSKAASRGVGGKPGAAAGSAGGVLQTVFLPTVDSDFLLLKVESLQAQLNEQKQLHEERVAALLTDRQLRAQEEERQLSNVMVQVEALSRQVEQLEQALQTTTRDYITARRDRQDAQDAAAAAQAQMVSEVSAARSHLAAARRQARAEVEKAAAAADGKMREYVDKFREQVRAREEELLNLTSLHTATKASADKRITSLESRVAKLLEANRLEDDERLDALLDQLEKKAPSLLQQQQQQPAKKKASAAAAGPGGAAAARRSQAAPAGGAGRRPAGRSGAAGGRVGAGQSIQPMRRSDQQQQQQAEAEVQRQQAEGEEGDEVHAGEEEEEFLMDTGEFGLAGLAAEDSGASSSISAPSSIKSTLAAELAAVRRQLADLEVLAGQKAARALAGLPGVR